MRLSGLLAVALCIISYTNAAPVNDSYDELYDVDASQMLATPSPAPEYWDGQKNVCEKIPGCRALLPS